MIRRRFVDRDCLREDFFQRLDRRSDAIANLGEASGIGCGITRSYAIQSAKIHTASMGAIQRLQLRCIILSPYQLITSYAMWSLI